MPPPIVLPCPRTSGLFNPRFSSGKHGDGLEMHAIFQILYSTRVSVALAGHDHHYERFAPLTAR